MNTIRPNRLVGVSKESERKFFSQLHKKGLTEKCASKQRDQAEAHARAKTEMKSEN